MAGSFGQHRVSNRRPDQFHLASDYNLAMTFSFSALVRDCLFAGLILALFSFESSCEVSAQSRIDSDQITRSIVGRSGRGDQALGESIAALIRLDQADQANALIQRIEVEKSSPQQLATIHRSIGPSAQIQLLGSPSIDARSREILRKLADADRSDLTDPVALRKAAETILATDPSAPANRDAAARRLGGGGLAAVKAIVEQLMRSSPSANDTEALQIALQVDQRVGDALVPWIMYGNENQVARATGLLGRLTRDKNQLARMIGESIAGQRGMVGNRRSAFLDALDIQRGDHLAAAQDGQVDHVWLFDPAANDGASLTPMLTTAIEAMYRRDADLSAGMRRIFPPESPGFIKAVAMDLSYRVLIDPDWPDASQIKEIRSSIEQLGDESFVLQVYRAAKQIDDDPAVLACVRIATSSMADEVDVAHPTAQRLLVDALQSDIEQARFESAIALAKLIRRGETFANQSVAMAVLSEASRLEPLPTIVLVETRPEIIGSLENRIGKTSYQVEVVGSVDGLIRRLAIGGDIRMVLSKRQLVDMTPIEMVDRVHRIPNYSDLPIAFFRDPEIIDEVGIYIGTPSEPLSPDTLRSRFGKFEGTVRDIAYPRTPQTIDRLIDAASVSGRLPALNELDRRLYSQSAAELIR